MNRLVILFILCGFLLAACGESLTPEQRISRLKRLTDSGEYPEAMEYYKGLKDERPTDAVVLMMGARLYFEYEQYDSALSCAKKYANLYSGDPSGYQLLYKVAKQIKDYDQMLWALSQLGYIGRDRKPYLPEIAQLNLIKGNPGMAVSVCRDIVEYDPENQSVLFTLGSGLLAIGKADSAIVVFEHLDDLVPDQLEILVNLGMCYATVEKFNKAEEIYGQVTVMYPDFMPGWYGLGNILSSKGDTTGAIEAYRHVYSIDPTFLGVDTLLRNLGSF
ncbi:MAG: tetratricopeptide repeat protein [Candidatus Zixiibacteriota bacterium]